MQDAEQQELLQAFEAVRELPAAIGHIDAQVLDERARRDPHGLTRRIALSVMARPAKAVFRDILNERESAEALAGGAVAMDQYLEHLEGVRKIVDGARTRIMVALAQREDAEKIMALAGISAEDAKPPC